MTEKNSENCKEPDELPEEEDEYFNIFLPEPLKEKEENKT